MNSRIIPPAIIVFCLLSICALGQTKGTEQEVLRQRYGIGPGQPKPAPKTSAERLLQERTKNVAKPAGASRVEKLTGEIVEWSGPGTVVVKTVYQGQVWVQTSETRQYDRPDPLNQIGLFRGGSGAPPTSRVVGTEGYYTTKKLSKTTTVAGVAQGAVKTGDKVSWKIEWIEGAKLPRLIGPAK